MKFGRIYATDLKAVNRLPLKRCYLMLAEDDDLNFFNFIAQQLHESLGILNPSTT